MVCHNQSRRACDKIATVAYRMLAKMPNSNQIVQQTLIEGFARYRAQECAYS